MPIPDELLQAWRDEPSRMETYIHTPPCQSMAEHRDKCDHAPFTPQGIADVIDSYGVELLMRKGLQ